MGEERELKGAEKTKMIVQYYVLGLILGGLFGYALSFLKVPLYLPLIMILIMITGIISMEPPGMRDSYLVVMIGDFAGTMLSYIVRSATTKNAWITPFLLTLVITLLALVILKDILYIVDVTEFSRLMEKRR